MYLGLMISFDKTSLFTRKSYHILKYNFDACYTKVCIKIDMVFVPSLMQSHTMYQKYSFP